MDSFEAGSWKLIARTTLYHQIFPWEWGMCSFAFGTMGPNNLLSFLIDLELWV